MSAAATDLPLDETRAFLTEHAHRRFRDIPAERIAEHVLAVTRGADFPVRRAALEALQRRMHNVESEGLAVVDDPPGGWLGRYVVARKPAPRRRPEPCPYETVLESAAELRGQCSCPDFIKGSLAMCKHLLAVLAYVYANAARCEAAMLEQPAPRALPHLVWDPVIPLTGSGDRLEGLTLVRSNGAPTLTGLLPNGRIDVRALADPERRAKLLGDLLGATRGRGRSRPAIAAGPAVRALVHWEHVHSTLEGDARREAKPALACLRGLERTLYPYQLEGVRRFLERGRLLLADDMGLGKTTQAIAACHALYRAHKIRRGLVIAPASLKSQWLREWQATTDVPAAVIDGGARERERQYREIRDGFVIASYELLLRDFDQLRAFAKEIVVLDEAQRIKNYATKSAVYVKALPAVRRLVLTGTPMENRLDELASILDWVDDRALAPKWRLTPWHIRYEGDGMKARVGARNLDTLRERLRGCVVRRVRSDVLRQLPSRTDTRVPIAMTPEQHDEHDGLAQPIAEIIARAAKRPLTQAEFLKLMQLLTTQRIIANGLGQLRFEQVWPSLNGRAPSPALLQGLFAPKLDELRRLIEALVLDQGRKVVVFSQWRRMLKLADWAVSDLLERGGRRTLFFTGAESNKLRTQSLVEFHDDPRAAILFLSDAGGVGLNLQRAANACINLELPWNPAVLEQRIARIYRLGQKRPIDVYNLVSESSIESRIAGIVGSKQQLFKGVFDGTTSEVRFDAAASFTAEVRQLIDEKVPDAPEPSGAPVDASDAPPEEAAGAEEQELEGDRDDAPVRPDAPADVARLLGALRIERGDDGRLRIDAPADAAGALAAMFETMAKLLREGARTTPTDAPTATPGRPHATR